MRFKFFLIRSLIKIILNASLDFLTILEMNYKWSGYALCLFYWILLPYTRVHNTHKIIQTVYQSNLSRSYYNQYVQYIKILVMKRENADDCLNIKRFHTLLSCLVFAMLVPKKVKYLKSCVFLHFTCYLITILFNHFRMHTLSNFIHFYIY
jgi:hypothetical protein